MRRRTRLLIAALVLGVATLVAYRPALDAGFLWDDQDYVLENSNLVRPDGLRRIWFEPRGMVQYYPVVHTALWLEHRVWQTRPFGYHLVNVLLHALNAVLLGVLLLRLAVPGAWFIAAVFALHPLQVESVAWVTEIKNLLSGGFTLAAALAFERFRAARDRRLYGVALGCFALALLSKTTAVTLPVVLLLLVWWKAGRVNRTDAVDVAPFFALGAISGAFTLWLETVHVGSQNVIALTMAERLLVPARALFFYAGKLVLPANLTFVYPRWQIDAGVWWQWMFPLAALALVFALWRLRHRIGRGPVVAVLIFAVTLAPVSGILPFYFQLYSYVGDHFQYMAGIALVALLIAPFASRLATSPAGGRWRWAERGLPVVILIALGWATWNRARVYHDEGTLWSDTLARNPRAWIAHNNLGVLALRQGRIDEAATHFEATLAARPQSPEARANLGVIFHKRGDTGRAIDAYRQAVAINPGLTDAQFDLGILLAQRGDLDEAARCFQQVIAARPRMADAHMRLGDVLATREQFAEAAGKYRDALALTPLEGPARAPLQYRLGWVLASQHAYAEARTALAESVRLNPRAADAQALHGWVLENLGDPTGAVRHYRAALALDANSRVARDGLARLGTVP